MCGTRPGPCGYPRSLQERYLEVARSVEDLTQELRRVPLIPELAARVGLSVEQVLEAIDVDSADRIQSLLAMRFVDELTQAEIGRRNGASQMCVSRTVAKALARLRANATRAENEHSQ